MSFINTVTDTISNSINSTITYLGDTSWIAQYLNNPQVLAEKILNCQVTRGSITIPQRIAAQDSTTVNYQTVTIPFYLEENFGFSMSNNWEPTIDLKLLNQFTRWINMGVSMVNQSARHVSFQSQSMSAKLWNGSEFSGFGVKCLFVCTNRSINPVEIIQTLATSCLPMTVSDYTAAYGSTDNIAADAGITGTSSVLQTLADNIKNEYISSVVSTASKAVAKAGYVAPLGYGYVVDSDSDSNTITTPTKGTTLTLRIGDWFKADNLLVKDISNVSFSKEIVAPKSNNTAGSKDLYSVTTTSSDYGFPLYATCNISFVPFIDMDLNTFNNYFVSQTITLDSTDTESTTSDYELPS